MLVLLLVPAASGCGAAVALGYVLKGEPMIDPEFKDLKEKRVAVVCYAPLAVRYEFDSVQEDLARRVAMHLRKNIRTCNVVDPDEVSAWFDEHGDSGDVSEVGKALGADYVVLADVQNFNLYEENSPTMYRGRAYVVVQVLDCHQDGEIVWEADHESVYPIGRPLSTADKRRPVFQREYISRLADEIGRYFYPYTPGADVKHF